MKSGFFRALALSLSVAVSIPQFSFAAITVNGNEVALETCGFQTNQVYSVTVQRTSISQGGRTNERGCVKTTFRDGKARAGDNLIIEVAGRRSSETVPGGSGGGSTQPGSGGSTQPVDNRDQVDISKVRQAAENQARFFANRVVIVYGSQENYRFNYHQGLRQGINLYNWSTISGVQNTFEFREGADRGRTDGYQAGLQAGRQQGASDGSSKGAGDAFGRYQAVVDQNRAPDTRLQVPSIQFSGLTASRSQVSMEDRLAQMEQIVRSQLGGLRFGDAEFAIGWQWDDYWSPRTLYGWNNFQFDLVRGWYREDRALDLYRQRALGGNYGSNLEYLARISDSSQTKNSSEARSAYESAFKSEYNRVIDSKWRSAVMASNPAAQAIGIQIGQQAAREHTRELGYNWAYSSAFTPASTESYGPVFLESYRERFQSTVQTYERNPMLGRLQGRILDAQGKDSFVLGAPVSAQITALVNFGRQNADVEVRAGSGLSALEVKKFSLGYSSSLPEARIETNIGRLEAAPAPGQTATVSVRVAGLSITQSISLRWDAQVAGLARAAKSNPFLTAYVVKHIGEEWARIDNTFSKNHYEATADTEDTLLEQMLRAAQSLPQSERVGLQTHKAALKAVFGEKPGRLSFVKLKKWNSAMSLIDRL